MLVMVLLVRITGSIAPAIRWGSSGNRGVTIVFLLLLLKLLLVGPRVQEHGGVGSHDSVLDAGARDTRAT